MSASVSLSNPTVLLNNNSILVVPNTFMYTEGFGEANVRVATGGGGNISTVYSRNLETALSTVKFDFYPTTDKAELVRILKNNLNNNVISFSQTVGDTTFSRIIQNAALVNDPEINLTADGKVSLEFKGSQAA